MMLRALFDERRRGEIRDALKAGRAIGFRYKAPASDARLDWERNQDMLLAGMDGPTRKAFFDAVGKTPEEASISEIINFAYGAPYARNTDGSGRMKWWDADAEVKK